MYKDLTQQVSVWLHKKKTKKRLSLSEMFDGLVQRLWSIVAAEHVITMKNSKWSHCDVTGWCVKYG